MNRVVPALLAIILLAGNAAAHGAPAARDHETRWMHDHDDDCGGDHDGDNPLCQGTHDLIALDVREAHDASLGDVVVFRFVLNGGTAGTLKDVLSFKAGGQTKTFEIRTTDNQAFQQTGFDRIGSATLIGDADRFAVEATVKRATLGAVDDKLTDFRVEAFRGATLGDYMPGGARGLLGDDPNGPEGSDRTHRLAGCLKPGTQTLETPHCYRVRGPGYYVTLQAPASISVAAGQEARLDVTLTNPFRSSAQTYTLAVDAGSGGGAEATLASGAVDVVKGGSGKATLIIEGLSAGSSGSLALTITSNLGGRSVVAVPYTITQSSVESTTTEPAEDSPAAGLPIAVGLLAFAALRRRT